VGDLAMDILNRRNHLDGITLSGGDPFYQQDECCRLLQMLPGMNVWIYTGFNYEDICDTDLAKMADVIVDGPFKEELRCEGQYFGSSNQRIIRQKTRS
jgi:anaerobic ribonucleoside-triphosphate reductase activating protein